jgi:hypothetical protein
VSGQEPPADGVWTPSFHDQQSFAVELLDLLNLGGSAGIRLGTTTPGELVQMLGEPRFRKEGADPHSLLLDFDKGSAYFRDGVRLSSLDYNCHPHYGEPERWSLESEQRGHDEVGLADLWIGAYDSNYCLRLGGRCVSYFSTFPKLIQYRPAGFDYELDARAGPQDKRLRVLAKRDQRELWLVYELSAFEVQQHKGRIFFDYCLAELSVFDFGVQPLG